ncbi:MAG: hypothetical protein B0W54_15550 [Cellvibrio sp. 79]|nr:MAG: hypothetical protein B0W54_15550 [Cellvibrio sp. 79]
MAFPRTEKKLYEKDRVDLAIDDFAKIEKPKKSDLNRVKVMAQIEQGIDKYRAAASKMSIDELEGEAHQSTILAHFMEVNGDIKPHSKCHAHAIVSGAHRYAAELRAILAWLKLRIDDPDNGCWLPENTAAKLHMPKHLQNAVPHSRIHRYNYYFWLNSLIDVVTTPTQQDLRRALNMVAARLQSGSQPKYVMNKKGEGLPI